MSTPDPGGGPVPNAYQEPPQDETETSSEPVLMDEEDDDDGRPLGERLPEEEAERLLRVRNLDTLVRGSAHTVTDSVLFETHGGDINLGPARPGLVIKASRLSHEEIKAFDGSYVDCPSYHLLADRLRTEHVVILKGPPSTGRRHTALMALAHCGVTAPGRLLLRGDPIELDAKELEEHTGYVLDATDATWVKDAPRDHLEHLGSLADKLSGRFVVLTDPDGVHGHPAIHHEPPDSEKVFASWLRWELNRLDYAGRPPDLRDLLGSSNEDRPPAESHALAKEVAAAIVSEVPAEHFASRLPAMRRQVAKKKLDDPRSTPGQRCFLISAAVLNELPLITISQEAAALELLMQGAPSEGERAVPTPWEWLSDWLEYAHAEREQHPGTSRVRLTRPSQAGAILEVVWQEGQSIREPVRAWLHRLAAHPAREVRIKVAHAVGRLAVHDFEWINREFLNKWSRARRQSESWLAAWALEAAYAADPGNRQVLSCLATWSRALVTSRTAARAYGSQIGEDRVDEALGSFRQMALRSAARQTHLPDAIARALADICTSRTTSAIIEGLAGWIETDHPVLRRGAVLALTRLASSGGVRLRLGDIGDALWPDIRGHLVALWREALTCGLRTRARHRIIGAPVHEAWTALGTWVEGWAEKDARRRAIVEGIFESDDRDLRAPLRVHLCRWFGAGTADAELCRHLHRLMEGEAIR
ncbi:hypothetical protein [Spongiactinospora sp. 9N601]|uniref:hypothetical protein n=1 Tax=Spongiactinospora sp. 9N601 TaxID=3375149 RepID=UPI0037A3ACB4